jgi:hypothetical protein
MYCLSNRNKIMENELKELGFTDFIHLRKSKRDGIKRKVWSGEYKNDLIVIIVEETGGEWKLKKIDYEPCKPAIDELMKNKNDLNSLILFIKKECRSAML